MGHEKKITKQVCTFWGSHGLQQPGCLPFTMTQSWAAPTFRSQPWTGAFLGDSTRLSRRHYSTWTKPHWRLFFRANLGKNLKVTSSTPQNWMRHCLFEGRFMASFDIRGWLVRSCDWNCVAFWILFASVLWEFLAASRTGLIVNNNDWYSDDHEIMIMIHIMFLSLQWWSYYSQFCQ